MRADISGLGFRDGILQHLVTRCRSSVSSGRRIAFARGSPPQSWQRGCSPEPLRRPMSMRSILRARRSRCTSPNRGCSVPLRTTTWFRRQSPRARWTTVRQRECNWLWTSRICASWIRVCPLPIATRCRLACSAPKSSTPVAFLRSDFSPRQSRRWSLARGSSRARWRCTANRTSWGWTWPWSKGGTRPRPRWSRPTTGLRRSASPAARWQW